MRNWNICLGFHALPSFFCFEPTYEELKHYYKADPRYENLSFEPTYEELKP